MECIDVHFFGHSHITPTLLTPHGFLRNSECHFLLSVSSFSYRELLLSVIPRYHRYSRILANNRKTPPPLKSTACFVGPCPNGSGTAPARTTGATAGAAADSARRSGHPYPPPPATLRRGRSLHLSLRVPAGNGAHPAAHGQLQPGSESSPRRLSRARRGAATPRRGLHGRARRLAPHLAWGEPMAR